MSAKRPLALAILTLILSSLLFPQTLAEIAQKERERRAGLKGKKAVVITNADLAKLRKKPALETPAGPPAQAAEETSSPETAPPAPAEPQEKPAAETPAAQEPVANDLKSLQERLNKAQEYVELLTLKMGALWQQFYSQEDLTTKDAVQQSIAETYIKLEKAQEEEIQARRDLEAFLGQQKKEPSSSIWIR
jgi:hypothetical protein